MGAQTDYLKLTMAIAGGVLLGGILLWVVRILLSVGLISAFVSGLNLTFNEQPASAVTRSASYRHAIRQQRADTASAADAKREFERQAQIGLRQKATQQRRAQSREGRGLWAACEEWSHNYKRTPTETIRINGKFYCDRYDRFIETGYAGNAGVPAFETR